MNYSDGFISASAFIEHIILIIILPLFIILALLGGYWYLVGRKSVHRLQVKRVLIILAYIAVVALLGGLAWYLFVFISSGGL